ncbi:beta-lactamase hydrolase domain-containing protein [Novosphingobium sp.]|uniref:beta-lactamase hydrolase domain-containing protein n=1 Tax=Novosphingobium sp. TaxID=1874826 RepID=UPI00286E0817|nr:sulfur transferase domain-containing protein [Novosphingobium sp.]
MQAVGSDKTPPEQIACWQRLSGTVTTSGHLEPADFDALAALGVRHAINLAMGDHPQILPDAAERFAALGIGYTHIPVPFAAPEDTHFAAFVEAVETAPRPLHVHCIMNWRVSAMFYRWHRDVLGMNEGEARAIMNRQWEPETNDYPGAAAWARFIAAGD